VEREGVPAGKVVGKEVPVGEGVADGEGVCDGAAVGEDVADGVAVGDRVAVGEADNPSAPTANVGWSSSGSSQRRANRSLFWSSFAAG